MDRRLLLYYLNNNSALYNPFNLYRLGSTRSAHIEEFYRTIKTCLNHPQLIAQLRRWSQKTTSQKAHIPMWPVSKLVSKAYLDYQHNEQQFSERLKKRVAWPVIISLEFRRNSI